MSLILQSSGGGQITIQEPTTASNFTQTLPAATGTVVISGTTPSLNGIAFPATQSASADANTLDDYEEGTWTVLVTCSTSGSVTTGNKTGRYVKVGNLVSVTMYIDFSAVSSPVGSIRITLPFTVANTVPSESAISCTFGNVASTNVSNFLGVVNNGTNFAEAFLGNSTGLSSTSANQLTSSSNFRLSAHYMTA